MPGRNITGAKSLCAVILSVVLLLLAVPPFHVAAEESSGQTGYPYAVTIEFGSMTFYYDYGAWDVNEMRYKADESSQYPANGTVQGYPGWYGFDGTANRISVKYSNVNEEDAPTQNRMLSVTLEYRSLQSAEGRVVEGIVMELYADVTLTVPAESRFTVPHTDPLDADAKTVLYVSLRGTPLENGGKYTAESFVPVGMLTVRVGEILDG